MGDSRRSGDSRLLGDGPLKKELRCDGVGDGERKSLPAPSKATRQSSDSLMVLALGVLPAA